MTSPDDLDLFGANDDIRRRLSILLRLIARQQQTLFDQQVERIVSGAGLSQSRWSALGIVARSPGITQRKLADVLGISETAAGKLVERMVVDGLIERRASDADKRAWILFVTAKARPFLERIGELAKRHEKRTFENISDADLTGLEDIFARIYRNLRQ